MKGPTPFQLSWMRALARTPEGKPAPVNEPSLRALERLGYVAARPDGHRRRVWALTAEGRTYLEKNPE